MVAIVDYGVGNLFSLECSLNAIGAEVTITADPEVLKKADQVLLPGVGAFEDAAKKLRSTGLDAVLKELAMSGKPLLVICLGMQMLFEKSYEY
ncbi:MAG: imidazole glycerol phosphate synthase subunit HisH, partial [Oscillospiraceae bacterium]|nr:imidazole glycerol phosphate synthase subunit HisH [Oscillospiraceae bacterium]